MTEIYCFELELLCPNFEMQLIFKVTQIMKLRKDQPEEATLTKLY